MGTVFQLLFYVVWVLPAIGFIIFIPRLRERIRQSKIDYKTVIGKIVKCEHYRIDKSDEDSTWYEDRYRTTIGYRINSRDYTLPGSVEKHEPDKNLEFTIIYNPDNPEEAFFEGHHTGLFGIAAGLSFIVFGILLLFVFESLHKAFLITGINAAAGLLFGLLAYNKKEIKKEEKDEEKLNLISGNPGLLTGEIKTLNNKMEMAYKKTIEISEKISKLTEYAALFDDDDKKDKDIAIIIEKQNRIIEYLNGYFDNYAAMFLSIFLQIKTEVFKQADLEKIDVENYIYNLQNDSKMAIQSIKNICSYQTAPHTETEKSIKKINDSVSDIKVTLISFHSNKIFANISPVEDDHNRKKAESNEDILLMADNLNSQYERFMTEKEFLDSNYQN